MKHNALLRFQRKAIFFSIYLTILAVFIGLLNHLFMYERVDINLIALDISSIALLLLSIHMIKIDYMKWIDYIIIGNYVLLISLVLYIFLNRFNSYVLIWLPPMAMSSFFLAGYAKGLIIALLALAAGIWCGIYAGFSPQSITSIFLSIAGSSLFGIFIYKALENFQKENESIRKDLFEQANKDPLTKLPNRRYFFNECNKMLSLAKRKKQPLAILSFDIDHFKRINDRYGHEFGDNILRRFASTLQEKTRSYDLVARMGGEEFAMCVIGEQFEHLLDIARKIKDEVAKVTFHNDRLTTSIGVYSATPAPEDSLEDFLKKADLALYKAKRNGRNRIEIYDKNDRF